VVAPGKALGPPDDITRPGFTFVETDYINGKTMKRIGWNALKVYLHSDHCDAATSGCTNP